MALLRLMSFHLEFGLNSWLQASAEADPLDVVLREFYEFLEEHRLAHKAFDGCLA